MKRSTAGHLVKLGIVKDKPRSTDLFEISTAFMVGCCVQYVTHAALKLLPFGGRWALPAILEP